MPPSLPNQSHMSPHERPVTPDKFTSMASPGREAASSSCGMKMRKSAYQRHGTRGTRRVRRSSQKDIEDKVEHSATTASTDIAPVSTTDNNSGDVSSNALALNAATNSSMFSPYGLGTAGMMGMYSYGSPYGMMGSPMMTAGPFSGLYQALFGFQNVIFSLGQVVQILGMNQQAMQQVFESISSMLDQAVASYNELRALEAIEKEKETEEQKKKRRRLKAIRWALVTGASCLVYKIFRRLVSSSGRKRLGYGSAGSNLYGPVNRFNSVASGHYSHGYTPAGSYGNGSSPTMHWPSTGYTPGGLSGGYF